MAARWDAIQRIKTTGDYAGFGNRIEDSPVNELCGPEANRVLRRSAVNYRRSFHLSASALRHPVPAAARFPFRRARTC